MQIAIKVLKGQDCTLDVDTSSTILELKQEIENKLQIPHGEQKLLLLGRTLNDENTISSYPNIREGTKLNLVVMRPRAESLRDVILRSFRKYYNEAQAERLTGAFMADFDTSMKQMSLDDIERMSESIMCV